MEKKQFSEEFLTQQVRYKNRQIEDRDKIIKFIFYFSLGILILCIMSAVIGIYMATPCTKTDVSSYRVRQNDIILTGIEADKYRLGWRTNAFGNAQDFIYLSGTTKEDRIKSLLNAYEFDKRYNQPEGKGYEQIKRVADKWEIKEEVITCIMKADSSLGKESLTNNNPGNVGNTDSGRKLHLLSIIEGIDMIGKTLNNQYLGYKQTIGSLSPGGGGTAPFYATSIENWFNNTKNCLSMIYNENINNNFLIRK